MKLNFAQRITVRGMMKADLSASATDKRNQVQAEVNSRPVILDKSVFVKSDFEKQEIKNAKAKHKRYLTNK
jgi:hypothetical protein